MGIDFMRVLVFCSPQAHNKTVEASEHFPWRYRNCERLNCKFCSDSSDASAMLPQTLVTSLTIGEGSKLVFKP